MERFEENLGKNRERDLNKSPFTGEDAEKLVEAELGEGVFKKEDEMIEGRVVKPKDLGAAASKKEERKSFTAVDRQIKELKEKLLAAKVKANKAKDEVEKARLQERVNFFRKGLAEAANIKERLKETEGKEKGQGRATELRADIAGTESRTHGPRVYTKESIPEDALERHIDK